MTCVFGAALPHHYVVGNHAAPVRVNMPALEAERAVGAGACLGEVERFVVGWKSVTTQAVNTVYVAVFCVILMSKIKQIIKTLQRV